VRTKNPQDIFTRYLHKFPKKASKRSKRRHSIIEVYSDRYYKSKLQNLVNEELKDDSDYASLSQQKQKAFQFSVYLRIRADCWKNESDEVKAEIQNIFDEEHGVKDEQDDENADGTDSKEDEDNDNDFSDDDDDDEKSLLQRQQE
jgi:hypothetical protein